MSVLGRLNRGETNIDFVKWWKRGLVLSGLLMIISVVSLSTRGLNLGIDFEGGVSWEVQAPGVSVDEARDSLDAVGEGAAKIQIVGADIVRVQGPEASAEHVAEVRQTLADLAGTEVSAVSVSTVGASWGSDITASAIRALIVFLIAIMIYLTIRLELRMALAAIVAVVHDVLISVGVYSVFQFEVTPGTVIAFLTILGYSIYDTIVVDDKIKENERLVGMTGRMSYTQMASLSMNQVLLRSLNTTISSLLPVLSLLVVGAFIMGAVTLEEFSVALTIGLVVGAYSSIFVAAPVLVFLKERQPQIRSIRERLQAQGLSTTATPERLAEARTPSASTGGPAAPAGTSSPTSAAPTPTGVIPPRPRKKTRKR
jgi:preprotein translocase subunit SecF